MSPLILAVMAPLQTTQTPIEQQLIDMGETAVAVRICEDLEFAALDTSIAEARMQALIAQAETRGISPDQSATLVETGMDRAIDRISKLHPDLDTPQAQAALRKTCMDYVALHPEEVRPPEAN